MKSRQRGVTLIESVVVMAIAVILLRLAVPAFSAWLGNVQTRTVAESLQSGLQLARAEAIRRNAPVTFWLTSTAVPQTADWLVGCATPVGTGQIPEQPGDCPGITTTAGLPAAGTTTFTPWIQNVSAAAQQSTLVQIATPNGGTEVTFSSVGLVTTNKDNSPAIQEIDITAPALPTAQARPLKVMISGGQIRMCDPALALANDPRGCN